MALTCNKLDENIMKKGNSLIQMLGNNSFNVTVTLDRSIAILDSAFGLDQIILLETPDRRCQNLGGLRLSPTQMLCNYNSVPTAVFTYVIVKRQIKQMLPKNCAAGFPYTRVIYTSYE